MRVPACVYVRRKWEPYRGGPFGLVSVLAADDGLAVVLLGVVAVADDHVQLHGCSPPCRVNRDFIIPFFREIKNASHFPRQIIVKSVRRTGIVASSRFCEWDNPDVSLNSPAKVLRAVLATGHVAGVVACGVRQNIAAIHM